MRNLPFLFALDGKRIYHVIKPFLCRHYDRMERRNPLDVPYDTTGGARSPIRTAKKRKTSPEVLRFLRFSDCSCKSFVRPL